MCSFDYSYQEIPASGCKAVNFNKFITYSIIATSFFLITYYHSQIKNETGILCFPKITFSFSLKAYAWPELQADVLRCRAAQVARLKFD